MAGFETTVSEARKAIQQLRQQERLVLSLIYAEGFGVRDVAAVLGLSRSRIYQVRAAALRKVRAATGAPLPRVA